ncbi:MAG TPA: vitamin K epoxide reductase family protein [Nitrospiraceae bacterium]|nr:vitamin K epoxide reductase family protein [Nitrospiraceae bacterium]
MSSQHDSILDGRPQKLRRELQHSQDKAVRRRRAIIVSSLAGMASMAVVSLFQAGLLRHLLDPPLRRFDSDRVNSSDTAYRYGLPDGPLSLTAHAANVALAAIGGEERTSRPWIPFLACGKAAAEAAVAAKYLFYQMPVVEGTWCGYCIVDALSHIGTFLLTLPEAVDAWVARASRRAPAHL